MTGGVPARYVLVAACGAALAIAAPLAAQTLTPPGPPQRPGLFGRAAGAMAPLTLSASALAGYDDNLIAPDTNGSPDPRLQQHGSYGLLLGTLAYTRNSARVDVGVGANSAVRYYPTLAGLVGVQRGVTATLTARVAGFVIGGAQTIERVPTFTFVRVPLQATSVSDLPAVSLDQDALRRSSRQLHSSGSLSRLFGRHTTLVASATREANDSQVEDRGLDTRTVAARVSQRLGRTVSLVSGVTYERADYRSLQTVSTRAINIDAGVDYDHTIGRRRRTRVGATTGISRVTGRDGVTPARIIADARVDRLVARTWHVAGAFHRGVDYVAGFDRPFFADSLALTVGGSFTRRLDLACGASYSSGQIGFATSSNQTESYSGSSRLRVALSRHAGLTAEYLLYRYRFDAAAIPVGLPPTVDRHGLRVGIDVWMPLAHDHRARTGEVLP